jgi:hypothetical protein
MTHNDYSPSGATPVRARSEENLQDASDGIPPEPMDPLLSVPRDSTELPHSYASEFRGSVPEDLRVPWGWLEVLLFVILAAIASVVVTWGAAEVAIKIFRVPASAVVGETMSTAKSIVVLLSQAAIDGLALVYFYLMVRARTDAPFWRSIGWRDLYATNGRLRASALQFLTGGAVLAVVVSFAGGLFNSKQALPIETLLQARISGVLFGVLGVLVAPLVEETIFRGFLYPVVARHLGITAGILITGTLFGLMHAVQLWGGWGQIALLMMVGVVLTWVRARTGTVAASYFVHLGYNGLQVIGFLIYVISGSRH